MEETAKNNQKQEHRTKTELERATGVPEQNTGIVESYHKPEIEKITNETVKKYLSVSGYETQLTDSEKDYFINIATSFQLNPFKREIYCIPYMKNVKKNDVWVKERALSIITGYETYLKRAERLGMLNGWGVRTEGDGNSMRAIITIYRKDWTHPFTHEVIFSEYNQDNKIWKEKPVTMIKKVVTAQGFRLAFPDEFGGLPYTADELPTIMTEDRTIIENNIEDDYVECSKKLSSAPNGEILARVAKEYSGKKFSLEQKKNLTEQYNIRKNELMEVSK